MGHEIANIQISKDVIEPIVRAQLHASILAAFGKSEELIGGVVHTIINEKVDDNGRPSSYSYAKPLITWMAEKAIKETAAEALKEWFQGNKSRLKEEIKKAISKNQKMMAEKFVMGMCETAQNGYRLDLGIEFKKINSGL